MHRCEKAVRPKVHQALHLIGKDDATITIPEGVIVAWRHIHMHPNDAAIFGVQDKDVVSVDIDDEERPLTFKNVLIRVSDKYKLEMHIDTDEGNAAELKSGEEGVLVSCSMNVSLHEKNV
jgi:acetate kinase